MLLTMARSASRAMEMLVVCRFSGTLEDYSPVPTVNTNPATVNADCTFPQCRAHTIPITVAATIGIEPIIAIRELFQSSTNSNA